MISGSPKLIFEEMWNVKGARSVGLSCGLPTKLPTGHGGPWPEPFRMTSCLVRVSYVTSRTKILVFEVRDQPGTRLHASDEGLHHQLHNGVCRNIANYGGERSPGLGEAPQVKKVLNPVKKINYKFKIALLGKSFFEVPEYRYLIENFRSVVGMRRVWRCSRARLFCVP
ncbi:hypothetical protein J6590_028590 [Homalodisca vitripennis]|nr:hypothetical protein J6590_028590 [Homalodisca vitripennis]